MISDLFIQGNWTVPTAIKAIELNTKLTERTSI